MAKKIEIKKTTGTVAPRKEEKTSVASGTFAFGKDNYTIILAGVGVLVLGYLLMIGGGAESPDQFHNDEIFSARRVTVAPITLLIGFGIVLYGIMKKPKQTEE